MHQTEGRTDLPPTAMSELETLALQRWATDKVCLELGAEHGYSTVVMARVARSVVSVDWHRGYTDYRIGDKANTVLTYFQNIREYRDKIVPIVARFEDCLPYLRAQSFDFIFIDGGHDWQSTYPTIVEASRLIRPDGVVASHDYGHPLCSERDIFNTLGWKPRNPVVGTLALFPPGHRGGNPGEVGTDPILEFDQTIAVTQWQPAVSSGV